MRSVERLMENKTLSLKERSAELIYVSITFVLDYIELSLNGTL